MELSALLPILLGIAWLLPLASFTLIVLFGPRMGKHGVGASYLATSAIAIGALCSWFSLFCWFGHFGFKPAEHGAEGHADASAEHAGEEHAGTEHADALTPALSQRAREVAETYPRAYTNDLYTLGQFGSLKITISYYIDALTVGMFAMVTLIATCIHFYAIGYMHDELHDVTDHEVTLSDGHHLHRPGRFHRFFQYLSLFCFSMLGLVYAGNIAMVFVFWELVGICSYFLIG
ncbi:MAG TPA: NADH-quinone oxidoreductase subunit L, partial [Pirellulales bacterium]|nr:NADH-quinone oxidoreductase subunit L [Pirellulales bacterium]